MRIIFLKDYTGRETAGKPYKAGDGLELDHQPAIELIALGVAREEEQQIEQPAKKIRKVKEVNDVTNS